MSYGMEDKFGVRRFGRRGTQPTGLVTWVELSTEDN